MHLLHYFVWSSKSTVADIGPFLGGDASYVFASDHDGRSILFFAAERGNCRILDHLLKLPNRPRLSDTDVNGLSLMHYAVRSRRTQTIEILYRHGCSIRAVDKNRQTALHHAVKRDNLEAVKQLILLDGSGLLDQVDSRGQTPLELAIYTGKVDVMAHLKSIPSSSSISTNDVDRSACHSQSQHETILRQSLLHWIYEIMLRELRFWQILAILTILFFGAWRFEKGNLGLLGLV